MRTVRNQDDLESSEQSSAESAASELLQLAPRIGRILRRVASARFEELELSLSLYRTLCAVRRRPRSMSELADRLMLSKQTVSQTVDTLVKGGFATRAEDPADRRHTIVTLTDAGLQRLETFESELAGFLAGALDGMPPDRQAEVAEALHELNALLVRRREEGYFKQPQPVPEVAGE